MSDKRPFWRKGMFYLYLLAFLIPVFMMVCIFAMKKIYPFGENCFLRTDLYHQYAMFFSEFQYKLQNGGSLLYSWDIGAGTNFVALYGYYLASPFNWLTMLIAKENLIEWLSILAIGKIGLCSLAFTWYLHKRTERTSWTLPLFGYAYAMSAYLAAYSWNIMWLDCLALAPLILWGLEKLVKEGNCVFYTVTLGLCILTNYYISIMVCLFLVLYFAVLIIEVEPVRSIKADGQEGGVAGFYIGRLFRFGFCSILAAGLACIVLLPEVMNLGSTASGSTTFPKTLTNYFSVLDMLARHCVNVTCEVGLDHWPNLYSGCAVFFLFPLYILDREISWRSKITRCVLLVFLLFCFSYNIPNYVWHGFHYPNSLPCRQSFLYTIVLLTMCAEATLHLGRIPSRQIVRAFWVGTIFLLVCDHVVEVEDFQPYTFYVTFAFMGVFALFAYLYRTRRGSKGFLIVLAYVVLFGELTMNMNITSITTVNRTSYWRNYESYRELAERMKADNPLFFRADKDMSTRRSKDDGAWLLYPSASVFSSEASSGMTAFYKKLGMEGSTNAYAVQGMTPIAASLMGIRYVFSNGGAQYTRALADHGVYKEYGKVGDIYAYENPYALSLGFTVSKPAYHALEALTGNPAEIQNGYLSTFTGIEDVFEKVNGVPEGTSYTFQPTKDGYYYAYSMNTIVDNVSAAIGDATKSFSNVKRRYLMDLGYIEAGTRVVLSNTNKEAVTASIYRLNTDRMDAALKKLALGNWQLTEKTDTHIAGTVRVDDNSFLLVTVPYEDGWSVTVDGIDTLFEKWDGAMIAVPLTAGSHEVVFDYEPAGFRMGGMISAASILILLLMLFISIRGRKKQAEAEEEPVRRAREVTPVEEQDDAVARQRKQSTTIPVEEQGDGIILEDLPKE